MSADEDKKHARDWEALLLCGAREVARTGETWFLAVVEDALGAGRWARREADVMGGSMTAALQTTVDVAKKLSRAHPDPEPANARSLRAGAPNIEVLTALEGVGVPRRAAQSQLAGRRAGVAPLLAALNEVVSTRAQDGYESLQSDERFWALLELIHEHGRRAPDDTAADDEPTAEDERGS